MFPEAEFYFLSFTAGKPMLRLLGFTDDRILTLDPASPWRFFAGILSLLRAMRRLKIDTTISFEIYVRFASLLAMLSGAERRVAFHRFNDEGHYTGRLSTHRLVYSPHHHISASYMALVQALADDTPTPEPKSKTRIGDLPYERLKIASSPSQRDAVQEKLRARYPKFSAAGKLVILNANASDLVAQRRWPLDNYAELARRLLEDPSVVVVLTGTAEEYDGASMLARRIENERVINFAGQTELHELITLFNISSLLVTNDSGPAHFASVTDLPTIVLFGPETPRIFGPLGPAQRAIYLAYACSPCVSVYNQKRSPCLDNRCMKDMTVETVLTSAREIMAI